MVCGLYAVLLTIIKDWFKNKQVSHKKYKFLIIFVNAMLLSYLAVNYSVF